jgi:hypothetical protein
MDRTFDCKPRLQESSPALPAQPETPHDGHLAGLLTYASGELETPSRVISPIHANISANGDFPSGLSFQVLSDYSCGAVADSHRASHYQTEKSYMRAAREVKGFGNWGIWELSNLKTEVQSVIARGRDGVQSTGFHLPNYQIIQLPISFRPFFSAVSRPHMRPL